MDNVKLMTPLFLGGKFNREGRKMRSVFLKEISDGTDTFRLWRSTGEPDTSYPRAENDKYLLHVEINGYLAPLGMTEFKLIDDCGCLPAIEKLYGGREQRGEYFRRLYMDGQADGLDSDEAIGREKAEILRIGGDPARQADRIREILDKHVESYRKSKENGGQTFPDFIGALVLDELPDCVDLRGRFNEVILREEKERLAERRRADEERVRNGNDKAEQAIRTALDAIRHGGTLENGRVELFTLTPEGYTVSEYSVVNHLMRRFGVDVPLRTQGWINEKLVRAEIKDGRCDSATFSRKGRGKVSQKFFDCMQELIRAVCGKEDDGQTVKKGGQ